MSKSPFFSIVVPAYHVADYIGECLLSVKGQPFTDWECLVVMEEGTDGTETIARATAGDDSRFRFFTQPKSGSAAASRNTGLANARGEYVIFLDGDDSLAEGSLGRLASRMAERPGADLYACAIHEYRDGTGEFIRIIDNYRPGDPAEFTGHDAVLHLYNHWHNPSPMVQENIHRRAFLEKNGLVFPYGIQHDDHDFTPREFYLAERIVVLHEPFYLYRRQAGSITMAAKDPGHFMPHMARVLKTLLAFHAKVSAEPGFDPQITLCWGREWIDWILDWFDPECIKTVSRARRRDALDCLFQDGFADFDRLLPAVSRFRRISCLLVKAWVRFPLLARLIDLLFRLLPAARATIRFFYKKPFPKRYWHGEEDEPCQQTP